MPISGIVIRLTSEDDAPHVRAQLAAHGGLELGPSKHAALAAVIDRPDYAAHDALLNAVRDAPGVASVDVVFHEFSDVREFTRLAPRKRSSGEPHGAP